MTIKRIDHIAIVVPNIEEALKFYANTLGLELSHVEHVEDQKTIVAFFPTGESEIELVEPTTGESGVARYMEKHGPGIHHICIEVDNLQGMLDLLKAQGVELINETPVIGSGGKKIAFVHPHSTYGVLIELYETTLDEGLRRASITEDLRKRVVTERAALTAGMMAFLRHLRGAPDQPAALTNGITIKAEGQIIDD
nr:methylmalonyl-CoA epimerase [Anaerolineae bacterium]